VNSPIPNQLNVGETPAVTRPGLPDTDSDSVRAMPWCHRARTRRCRDQPQQGPDQGGTRQQNHRLAGHAENLRGPMLRRLRDSGALLVSASNPGLTTGMAGHVYEGICNRASILFDLFGSRFSSSFSRSGFERPYDAADRRMSRDSHSRASRRRRSS
jgi:hypothetical protein